MVDVDTSELDEAQRSVLALGADLEPMVADTVEDEAEHLVEMIQNKIKQKGLVDTGELLVSFQSNESGASRWTVWSSADHAMPLEEGSAPHRIEPDDAALLAWEPENPADYPTKDEIDGFPTTWYDPDAGMVFSSGVSHPGTEEYNFVAEAQAQWAPIAMIQVSQAVDQAIIAAGFERGMDRTGGMPAGLGGPDFIDG